MGKANGSIAKVDDIFKKIRHEVLQNGGSVLMSYFGGFSTTHVGSFTNEIEHIMKSKNATKVVTKRMFTAMVEGLQNICLHGVEITPGKILGHIMLVEREEEYLVSFGNFVDNNKKRILTKYLNKVNGMTALNLKSIIWKH